MTTNTVSRAPNGRQHPENIQLLEGLLNILPGYLFYKNTDSVYLGCNLNFAELVGLNDPDDIIGKSDHELPWRNKAGQLIMVFQRWDEDVVNDNFFINRHLNVPLPTGDWIIAMNKTPIPDETGNVIGIAGFFSGQAPHLSTANTRIAC